MKNEYASVTTTEKYFKTPMCNTVKAQFHVWKQFLLYGHMWAHNMHFCNITSTTGENKKSIPNIVYISKPGRAMFK